MTTEQIQQRLVCALTTFDRQQSTRRGHNPYALGQYLERVDAVMADIEAGATPRAAVLAGFCGPLQRLALRAIGEAPAQASEESRAWAYQPASEARH
jgi:hypothetical protein